ncbi:hypothetical protein [Cerasicoccus frondis]|uniref:hypothetical protein n=1 Tax=Cerasicoccus frondis TaxID=490090 RepID=UPI0028529B75|nr:hypothetical protein [Cerasicoccus frondis]
MSTPLLYAIDLSYDESGAKKSPKVTIERITLPGEIVRENKQATTGPVVHFKGAKKALELCKTNQAFIRLACGLPIDAPIEECIGKEVQLTVRFVLGIGNEVGPAVRVVVSDPALIPFKFKNPRSMGKLKPWTHK